MLLPYKNPRSFQFTTIATIMINIEEECGLRNYGLRILCILEYQQHVTVHVCAQLSQFLKNHWVMNKRACCIRTILYSDFVIWSYSSVQTHEQMNGHLFLFKLSTIKTRIFLAIL